ncbi:MAG: type I-C CRISPR-associated protein Cas8c/Csd1 [Firmicutes bacterium]|nr:type I-C CRISPR-associated protein Cas8c/Csd1 [Bacillota bacterium]
MIIDALNRYYDILSQAGDKDVPRYGYCVAKVSHALTISDDGDLIDVISLMEPGNKGKLFPRDIVVPEHNKRSANINPNYMCDNSTYVLGIDGKDKPKRTARAHQAFKELHQTILAFSKGHAAKAILKFLEKWNPGSAIDHPVLKKYIEDIIQGSNLVFRLDGQAGFLHEELEIKQLWEAYISNSKDDIVAQCLVTGEIAPIAVLHPSIKKVKGAQSSGASLVSFNAPSYESYGKTQSFNSPTSKKVAFSYTTVLNHILSRQNQRIQVGDSTTVFWAESPSDIYTNLAAQLFNPSTEKDEAESGESIRDVITEELIHDVLYRAKTGSQIGDFNGKIDASTRFYILGLAPNSSRLSVRFFQSDSFGGFVEKVAQHYKDMEIVKDFESKPTNIPLWMMLSQTVSQKGRDKDAKPLLAGAVMRSIITGTAYPASLFNAMIMRVRADMDDKDRRIERVNYIRASIIKAYLVRNARLQNNQELKEVLTVSLNEQSTNTEYLLGRLFAILEKAQQDANPGINATIKDRYFASACATPGAVFPILLRLAQHHISKSDYGYAIDKRLEPIINGLTKFPSHLSLEQQGTFILGYYHQRVALYQKAKKEVEEA